MVRLLRVVPSAAVVAGVFLALAGCSGPTPPPPDPAKAGPGAGTPAPPADGGHGHKPTAHGGTLVSVGSRYHAEAVFEKGGVLRLYTLGRNEAVVLEVEAEPLTAYVRAEGAAESESVVLAPRPQPGDKAGMTSLFVGHLPKDVAGKNVEVTIPAVRIGAERFRVAFKSAPAPDADGGDHGMPAKAADAEERKLYLTPGGKYTDADIRANGGAVASAKFKGLRPDHDLKPKPGDAICPITLTKANPKFAWVIGGQTYLFCCPPCVDEFVALAKEKPDEVQEPGFYRKK